MQNNADLRLMQKTGVAVTQRNRDANTHPLSETSLSQTRPAESIGRLPTEYRLERAVDTVYADYTIRVPS